MWVQFAAPPTLQEGIWLRIVQRDIGDAPAALGDMDMNVAGTAAAQDFHHLCIAILFRHMDP